MTIICLKNDIKNILKDYVNEINLVDIILSYNNHYKYSCGICSRYYFSRRHLNRYFGIYFCKKQDCLDHVSIENFYNKSKKNSSFNKIDVLYSTSCGDKKYILYKTDISQDVFVYKHKNDKKCIIL